MECITVSAEVKCPQKKCVNRYRSDYDLDFWREVKKRWLVLGVLISVTAAVLCPWLGSSGGPLYTQYLRYLPLVHIYYSSGKRTAVGAPQGGRAAALAVLHAHVTVPALCLTVISHTDTHPTIVKGAMLSSVGAGCGWVSLALAPGGVSMFAASALLVANYATSIVATPVLKLIICGRATVPHLGGIISTILTALTPFAIGVLTQHNSNNSGGTDNNTVPCNNKVSCNNRAMKLSALVLLYVDCCDLLREAEGSLYVGDVLCTLMLVVCWVASSAGACALYARAGLVPAPDARLVALTAIPKCLDPGWESTTACSGTGLSRLPAAFLAPAQALLLAAMFTEDDDVTGDVIDVTGKLADDALSDIQHDG